MKTILTAVLIALAMTNAANAQVTGKKLYDQCSSKLLDDRTYCLGYLRGFGDGLLLWQSVEDKTPICLPSEVSPAQIAALYQRWWKANPKSWHKDAGWITTYALMEAFPCKEDKQS